MKKWLAALLVLTWLIPAGLAWAEPPVLVSHSLTGYTVDADAVTLNYTLNVKNAGTGSISNFVLSLDSLPLSRDQITLNIASLDPQTETQISFTLTTSELIEENAIRRLPLFWTCEGAIDGVGPMMFPVVSVDGGAL